VDEATGDDEPVSTPAGPSPGRPRVPGVVVAGLALLGEPLTARLVVAGAMILGGIALAILARPR
jgi:drug/metabolite transporter (DMT)-like permease